MFLVAASTAVWATNGQPFAACQRRFGAGDCDRDKNAGPRLPARKQAALRRGEEAERD